jgi:hypothetical protein
VDILQKTIKRFSKEGWLQHPVDPTNPCPVIQYADDTLILFQGCPEQAKLLKEILDAFSTTTDLTINYAKSMLVTINLEEQDQTEIANILGCPIASFPQTYLGLPFSDSNLPRWVLQPLIHSLDCNIDTLS